MIFACPAQNKTEELKKPIKKYSVKPPRDLHSNFERRQEEKQQAEAEAAELKKQLDEERLQKVGQRMFQWNSFWFLTCIFTGSS